MDDPWQPPTGQVPPVIPHATQLAREGGISFEACSHETDSSLYSDFEYIENRSYSTDSVQRTSPGYRSRVMLNGCVDAELVGTQVDRKKRKPSANDDVDLLLSSSTPSCLIPALPFIFIGDDMSVISSAMLQTSHVAAIQAEFISVKAMGEATAEEWLKGLKERGRERRADSLRWEKFEMSGGLARIRRLLSSTCTEVNSKLDEATKVPKPSAIDHVEKQSEPLKVKGDFVSPETALATLTPSLVCSWDPPHAQPSLQSRIRSQINVPRNKTREEAEEMKATRRAEIEKRAMELKPPIPAHILSLIPSFQAAIQITSPLDNAAWNLLKSRLVAQRQDVDREQEQETSSQSQYVQAPLRARISVLADQIIHDGWEGGRNVNKESTPQFAAEVLLHVRTQFYTEIQEDDSAARAAGQQPISEPVNGPYTRRLTLENMKWLFDVKIKPFTETYGKKLFYCYSCINTVAAQDKDSYSLPQLAKHFYQRHIEQSYAVGAPELNWCIDMVYLPDFNVLSNLGNMANIDNRKLALISTALSQTASQLNPGQFPPPRLLNHKIPSHRNRFSTVYPSHQQAPLPHTRFQHLEILQDTGQDDPEPHNLDKGTLETTQSKPSSKSLLSKADDRYTNGVCADITATSDEKPSLNTELAKRQLSTNDLARCPDQDTPGAVENNEDDSFDLLAGLESQLDRQALSNCLDTP
ncbi:hypothetical protein NUW58_g4460 [Xylaria curta]|uniref:Uncharacterized protein n=1 Tax=Xylaria curta TaxID=42375 RepID=A0ACC1P7Y7_9PEZI|nr:hypothetical protein NUW58_g4460 [Xylaria curta]